MDKIEKYLTNERSIEEETSKKFGEGVIDFLGNKRGSWVISLTHSLNSLKEQSSRKAILEYTKAERKLWDNLVDKITE